MESKTARHLPTKNSRCREYRKHLELVRWSTSILNMITPIRITLNTDEGEE